VDSRSRILTAVRPAFAEGARPSVEKVARAAGISRATFYRHFRSRDDLIRELAVDPDPATRDRVLETALDLVGRHGLAALSMDELAATAGVSRATVYRLFPGKPALFREVVRAFSPLEAVVETLSQLQDRPPDEVMPAIAMAAAGSLRGRMGVVRAVFMEVSGHGPDTAEAVEYVFTRGLTAVMGYVMAQMAAGRLRQMHPLLALQSFIGPILFHLMTRELVEERLGLDVTLEDAVSQLATSWVRAMHP
jgi:AcrR family transcriptional regulator